jgi:hypothetical protein
MGITRNRLVADLLTPKVRRLITRCESEINLHLLETGGAPFNYYLHLLDKLPKSVREVAVQHLYWKIHEAGWIAHLTCIKDETEYLAFRGGGSR